jgi:hypothetical protein
MLRVRLEELARDKRASLFCVSGEGKKFSNLEFRPTTQNLTSRPGIEAINLS